MSKNSVPSLKDTLAPVLITQLGPQGDGIGDVGGKRIFVPYTCPGDVIQARITQERKDFLRGEIQQITTPSLARTKPPCPHFGSCGGCSLQQLSSEAYGNFKRNLLIAALRHAGINDAPAEELVALPAASRRRATFTLRHDQNDGLILGYHTARSHDLTGIRQCLILAPALQDFLPRLSAGLTEIEARREIISAHLTLADTGIDLTLELKTPLTLPMREALISCARTLGVARLSYVCEDVPEPLISLFPVQMLLGDARITLPPATFLQATAEAQAFITARILSALAGKKRVLDLFSGIGTYSFPLAKQAVVHAVEGQEAMTRAIIHAAAQLPPNRLSAETRDLFVRPMLVQEINRFDAAVINPPRAGAAAQMEHISSSGLRSLVMVSCDPASFARDAATLTRSGWKAQSITPIDQFPWSAHLEIVGVFEKRRSQARSFV